MMRFLIFMMIIAVAGQTGITAEINDYIDFGGDILGEFFKSENVLDLNDGLDDDHNLLRAEAHLYFQSEFDQNLLVRVTGEVDRGLNRVYLDSSQQLIGLNTEEFEFYIDEALIKMNNIAGGGFSFSVGRQFLNYGDNQFADNYNQWWGPGFIIADSLTNDPLLITQLGSYEIDPFDAVVIRHESEFTQFDVFYARDTEDFLQPQGIDVDVQMAGFYASYFGIEDHQLDLYFTYNEENSPSRYTGMGGDKWIFGGRAAGDLSDHLAYKAEIAYQIGNMDNTSLSWRDDSDALGTQAGLNYHPESDLNPNVGFIYTYLQQDGANGTMSGFSAPFEGKTYGIMAEGLMKTLDGINPFTNMHVFNLNGGLQPTERLAWTLDLYFFLLDEEQSTGTTSEDDGGVEMDTQVDYLFNKHLRTFVGGGVYFPGDALKAAYANQDDDAFFLRAGIKVQF